MMGFGFVVARFGWFLRELAVCSSERASASGCVIASMAVMAVVS